MASFLIEGIDEKELDKLVDQYIMQGEMKNQPYSDEAKKLLRQIVREKLEKEEAGPSEPLEYEEPRQKPKTESEDTVYTGDEIMIRVCPLCEYKNDIYAEKCKACTKVEDVLDRAKKKHSALLVTDPAKAMFKIYREVATKTRVSPEVVSVIDKRGATPLPASTVQKLQSPTLQQKMQSALHRLNADPTETETVGGVSVPKQSKEPNFFTLKDVLAKLSVIGLEDSPSDTSLDLNSFYEEVIAYNTGKPEAEHLLPVTLPGGRYISPETQEGQEKLDLPESTYKGESTPLDFRPDEGYDSPDRKQSGYSTTWAWNDWESPITKKHHVGIATVFEDRIKEVNIMRLMKFRQSLIAGSNRAEAKIKEYSALAQEIANSKTKYHKALDELREKADEDDSMRIKFENFVGDELTEMNNNIAKYVRGAQKNIEKIEEYKERFAKFSPIFDKFLFQKDSSRLSEIYKLSMT
jgi:hypothetical protein